MFRTGLGLGLDIILSTTWSYGVHLVVFVCSGISEVLFHFRFSRCHNTFLPSPHLSLIIGLIRDLFVPYVDSLMCEQIFMRSKCSKSLQKLRARVLIK